MILKNLYQYKYLFFNLITNDLKLRYKKSFLGFFWTFLNPLGLMFIYAIVFSQIMRFDMKNFHIFLLCGLLPWNFFASSLIQSSSSILNNAGLIKKVYVPKEIFPLSIIGTNLINYVLSLIPLGIFLWIAKISISFSILFLPLILIIQIIFMSGLVLILSSITIFFRDVVHILEIVISAWFFLTPIIYPIQTLEKGPLIMILKLNPMAYIIEMYHNIFYYGIMIDIKIMLLLLILSLITYLFGSFIFKRLETEFMKKI
ncbi:MAG: ABC transporter permease [bacterium]